MDRSVICVTGAGGTTFYAKPLERRRNQT